MIRTILTATVLAIALSSNAMAMMRYTPKLLRIYAEIIGRANGCGIDTGYAKHSVNRWMDHHLTRRDKDIAFKTLLRYVDKYSYAQSEGFSPDTCTKVESYFVTIKWPA